MSMTHQLLDRAQQSTTTTGTGTLSMGAATTNNQALPAGTVRYFLKDANGAWETGEGVLTAGSPPTLTRATIFSSSNAGAVINLSSGTHTVSIGPIAKSAAEMTPRLLVVGAGITIASSIMTIDCMGACDVQARVTLSENITTLVLNNKPEERCQLYLEVRQPGSGGPFTFPQAAWPSGTVFESAYNLYTNATVSRFWWTTTDGGIAAIAECNAPAGDLAGLTAEQARAILDAAKPAVVTISANTPLTKAAHQGKVLYCTAAVSLTVDTATDFDALAGCEMVAAGGIVTVVATATVRRIGTKPLTIPQYGRAVLTATTTTDEYLLTGEMA